MNLDTVERLTLRLAPRAIIRWNKKGVTHIISDSFIFNDSSNMDYTKEASYDLRIDDVTKVSEKWAVTVSGTKIPALEEKPVFENEYSAGEMDPLMLDGDMGDVLPILYNYKDVGYDAVFSNRQYVQIRLGDQRTITFKREVISKLNTHIDEKRNVSVHKTYSISGKKMDEIITVDGGLVLRVSAPPIVTQTCQCIWPYDMIDLFTDMAIIQSATEANSFRIKGNPMVVNRFRIQGNTIYVMINHRWYKAAI